MQNIHHKISPSFIRKLEEDEDTIYNTRSKTNIVLDAKDMTEIFNKYSYKVPKISTFSLKGKHQMV